MRAALVHRFAGLFNSVNPYSVAPEGAMEIADNCVIRAADVLEPRRGYATAQWNVPFDAFGWKDGKIIVLTWDNPAKSIAGALAAYDLGLGTPSLTSSYYAQFLAAPGALAMSPGGFPFDRPGGVSTQRTRFVSANKAVYFQSRYGLTKIEDLATAKCRCALQPVNWTRSVGGIAGVGFGSQVTVATGGTVNWLANGFQVAYRYTICRLGANKEVIESAPSERVIASNASGLAGYVTHQIATSYMVPTDAFVRIYRSKQVANGTDPLDELFLDAEVAVNSASPDSNGYCRTGTTSNYTDYTPDTSLYVPLYTNPTSGGTLLSSADPAPLAADMAYFKNRLLLLNTTDVHRLTIKVTGTSTGGIVDGDTITIDGVKFTFRTSPVANRDVQVYTAGSVAQNIENTARYLANTINGYFGQDFTTPTPARNLQSVVLARYISTTGVDAGQVLLQRLVPGATSFDVLTSSRNGWGSDYTTAVTSDPNAQQAGLSWSQQGQPESVPLTNSTIVGDASSAGQRVIPLKEAALIFKADGLWRWTDDGVAVALQIADPTVRLIAPDTAQPLSNFVFGLCDAGVLLFTENGQSVNVSDDPIGKDLLKLIPYVGRDTLARVAFAVAHEADHLYILSLPESPNATTCTIQYVFNLQTRAWTRWTLGVAAGSVNPANGCLVWSVRPGPSSGIPPNNTLANDFWVERRNGDSSDYFEPGGYDLSAPVNTITDTWVLGGDRRFGVASIAVGDIIWQPSGGAGGLNAIRQRVKSVTYNSGTNLTTIVFDSAPPVQWNISFSWLTLKAVRSILKFLPLHAGSPTVAKERGDAFFAFRYFDLDWLTYDWSTDLYPIPTSAQEQVTGDVNSAEPKPPIIKNGFGSDPFGTGPWDRQVKDVVLRTTLPAEVSSAAMLTLQLTLANATCRWELSAIDVKIAASSHDVNR